MPSKPASAASVSSSAARVWITTGLPSSAASASCAVEQPPLRVARRVVAEVVEPGLADRDGALVPRAARAARRAVGVVVAAGLVRVDAERGVDARRGAAASSSASRAPAIVVATTITRSTPASRARSSTSRASAGSRCAWVSIIRGEVVLADRRVELAEERRRLAQRLAGRELARLPARRSSSRSRRSAPGGSGRPPRRPRGTRAGRRASPRSRAARAASARCAAGTA